MINLPQFKQLISHCYHIRHALHGRSQPGLGKTEGTGQQTLELAKEYTEDFGLHTVHLSCMDSIDAEGIRFPKTVVYERNGKKHEILVSGVTRSPLLPPPNAPRRGIVLLDEVMQATQDVLKPVARFVNERKIGEHELPAGWSIVMLSNRVSDKSGVTRGMAFLTNRQCMVQIAGDLDAWVHWAMSNDVHPFVVAFVKFKKGDVFSDRVPDDPDEPFMTPRSIVRAGEVLTEIDEPILAREAVAGWIGSGHAAELMAFCAMADQLPTYEQIRDNPEKTQVPSKPDACYAVTQMLAHRVEPDDALAVFKYLKRLPKEFQVSCLKDAMSRPNATDLLANREFATWVQENSYLVIAAHGSV